MVFLGVDIGTSSSEGVLVTPDVGVMAQAELPHEVSIPRPGWFEQDAESAWWADFTAITRKLVATVHKVDGISVSGIGPCLLPADGDGSPLRAGILYGIGTRATPEVAELNDELGAEEIQLPRPGGDTACLSAIANRRTQAR